MVSQCVRGRKLATTWNHVKNNKNDRMIRPILPDLCSTRIRASSW